MVLRIAGRLKFECMRKLTILLNQFKPNTMKQTLLALIFAILTLVPAEAWAKNYSVTFDKATPLEVITTLKRETGLEFTYQKDLLKHAKQPITCSYSNLTLEQLLNRVISMQMVLGYEVVDKNVVLKQPKLEADFVSGEITGIVYDKEMNEPLPGATVVIDGTTTAVATDVDGRFKFTKVQALNPVITALYVGFKPMSIKVTPNNQKDVRFDLLTQTTMMTEVVVTGYGDIKKEKMTGSAVTLNSEALNERYTPNILENLEGKVAGLSTYGGKPVIRGTGTLFSSTNPLLVVDGLPIEGNIEDLNPYDIESVNILKDAAASAIYGARASNGIIVVTTKNAKKQGKIEVDFSANVTAYQKHNFDYADNFYLTPEQHVNKEAEYNEWFFFNSPYSAGAAVSNAERSLYGGTALSPIMHDYYQLAKGNITRDELNKRLDGYKKNNYARDFAKAMYHRQVIQQYNLALRSNTAKSRNNVVLNYKTDSQNILNERNHYLNFYYKGSFDIAKWLTANVSVNGLYTSDRAYGGDSTADATNIWKYAPYMPFYNEDGSIIRQHPTNTPNQWYKVEDGLWDMGVDPTEDVYDNVKTTQYQSMRYHGDLLFKILPGLTANAQFIYEVGTKEMSTKVDEDAFTMRLTHNAYAYLDAKGNLKNYVPDGGLLRTENYTDKNWTARGQLNYTRTFLDKHDIALIAGVEFRENYQTGNKGLVLGWDEQMQTSATHTVNFAALQTTYYSPYFWKNAYNSYGYSCSNIFYSNLAYRTGSIDEKHRFGSGYFNATYTFDGRYNVFGSFRKDYADMYGMSTKFRAKPLWSVGAGWNMHKESFMRDIEWINFLKLRASYGVTGNMAKNYTSYLTADTGNINSWTNLPFARITSPANPFLRWETSKSLNLGVDYNLLDFRLRGSIDYYDKKSEDILSLVLLDPSYGFAYMPGNIGSVRNRGVEIAAAYDWFRPTRNGDFGWTTSLTFTHNKSEMTAIENPYTASASQFVQMPWKIGYPVSALFSFRFAGISDQPGEEGTALWYGENDEKKLTVLTDSPEILEYSGQTDPKTIVGMDNQFQWKGFTLGVTMVYYGGHKMRCLTQTPISYTDFLAPVGSYAANTWTPDNKSSIPGFGEYQAMAGFAEARYSNQTVYDASFLKIRNIVLGYNLPTQWTKKIGINQAQLRFQVNDPKALWTANKMGIDPETLGIAKRTSYVVGLNINI